MGFSSVLSGTLHDGRAVESPSPRVRRTRLVFDFTSIYVLKIGNRHGRPGAPKVPFPGVRVSFGDEFFLAEGKQIPRERKKSTHRSRNRRFREKEVFS